MRLEESADAISEKVGQVEAPVLRSAGSVKKQPKQTNASAQHSAEEHKRIKSLKHKLKWINLLTE